MRMKVCTFEGCGRKQICKGFCKAHYSQSRRGVELHPIWTEVSNEFRLLKHVNKTDTCWVWTGCTRKDGYGVISVKGTAHSSHRFSYELFVGPIPEGMTIHHKCANRLCCNPDHLDPATNRDNLAEMFARKAYETEIAQLKARIAELEDKYERQS